MIANKNSTLKGIAKRLPLVVFTYLTNVFYLLAMTGITIRFRHISCKVASGILKIGCSWAKSAENNPKISILPGQYISCDGHLPLENLQYIATMFCNTFWKISEEPSWNKYILCMPDKITPHNFRFQLSPHWDDFGSPEKGLFHEQLFWLVQYLVEFSSLLMTSCSLLVVDSTRLFRSIYMRYPFHWCVLYM